VVRESIVDSQSIFVIFLGESVKTRLGRG